MPVEPELVFILGPHRSGTSILYHVLAASGAFRFLRVRQIVELQGRHDGLAGAAPERLQRYFEEKGIATRMIDGLRVGPDSPEEYGFLLEGRKLTDRTVERFGEVLRAIAADADPHRPILLKNP
jgi:hypothetical protein